MSQRRSCGLSLLVLALLGHLVSCSGTDRVDVFALCGNGILDPGEQCDEGGANSDMGNCLTTCVLARCGDGFVDVNNEQCDGNNLRFRTCASLGFRTGTLACSPDCVFDTSRCGAAFTPTATATPVPTATPTP